VVLTFLARRVRGNVARQLLLDPDMLSAERALAIGLVDQVVDDGCGLAAARERALAIATKAAPSAIAATKQLLNDVVGLDWRAALAVAAEANVAQRLEPDCRRGVRSFLASKRTPDWLADDATD
jgi:enoyl-CoA hydratase